jgi:hypothetical protein
MQAYQTTSLMSLLLEFTLILLLGAANFCTVTFIDFCFNEGNILDFYYQWVLDQVEPRNEKLAKVLGTCPVCFGFWVGLVAYCLYAYYFNLPIIGFIPFISLSEYLLIKRFAEAHD